MNKTAREGLAAIAAAGLVIERTELARSVKVYVVAPDGRRTVLCIPLTPSDHRAAFNRDAQIRAFAENRPTARCRCHTPAKEPA